MADGTIKPGGDKCSYLGHFRGAGVVKEGHNFGAPRNVKKVANAGVPVNKYLNPVLAARVAKRESVQSAKASGGDVKAARQAGRADVQAAKKVRSGFNAKESALSRQSYKQTVKSTKPKRDSLGVKWPV